MSHVDEGTLHAYLDGELPASERARVDAHLAGCEACRTRLEEERDLIARASRLLARAAPPEQAAPPLGTIRRRSLLRRARLPAAWAASVVLALAAGWYAGVGSRQLATFPVDESRELVATEEPKATAPASQRRREIDATTAQQPRPDATPATPAAERAGDAGLARRAEPPAPAAAFEAPLALKVAEQRSAWSKITLDSARDVLGADPVTVPDLPIGEVRASAFDAGAVIVEQVLAPGVTVELHQRRATPAPGIPSRDAGRALAAGARNAAAAERLARYVGPLRVEIAGPLPPDSLSRLLEKARPTRP